jgi:flagellar assembly factor FliW
MVAQAIAPEETTTIEEQPLRFIAGMPGLEEYHRFTLAAVDGGPLYWLACVDEPAITLPAADAFAIDPDYSFELSDGDVASLALRQAADALVLSVLTVAPQGQVTANLLAPVIVNRTTGAARQVILDGTSYALRHPVMSL